MGRCSREILLIIRIYTLRLTGFEKGLDQESKGVTVGLSQFDEFCSQVVSPGPFAEIPNSLTVQTNTFSPEGIQFLFTEGNLCYVHGRRENSEFRFLSSHVQGRRSGTRGLDNWCLPLALGNYKSRACSLENLDRKYSKDKNDEK